MGTLGFSRTVCTVLAAAFLLIFTGLDAEATHLRYAHVTWQPADAGGNAIDFTVAATFRRNGFSGSGGDGFPVIGDTFAENIGGSSLCFGDGNCTGTLVFEVTAYDIPQNWILGTVTTTHTYAAPGSYTAGIEDCCRISGCQAPNAHMNNPDGNYSVSTLVDVGSGNSSPVSSLPPIVVCPTNRTCTFPVPVSDNENDPITFRLSSSAEAGGAGGFTQPGSPNCPNPLTIDAVSGIATWDSTGCTLGDSTCTFTDPITLYSAQITIEDPTSSVALDFLIQLDDCAPSNNDPVFDGATPTCGSTIPVGPGNTVSFDVNVSDADVGDTITLNQSGVPASATLSPGLPSTANPVSSAFSWTPDAGDIGQHVITFSANDSCIAQTLCSITIDVNNEICDDEIDNDGDGLVDCDDPDCLAEPVCGVCGNGVVETNEECDDGNLDAGDCCSALCEYEAAGSACTDDGNACTDDQCNATGVCQNIGNTDPCDDGDYCTVDDTCGGGSCVPGTARDCSGSDSACGSGVCNSVTATCDVTPANEGQACDDGLYCTVGETCTAGLCNGGTDPCVGQPECFDTCDEVADVCVSPVGTPCTADSDICTDDVCDGSGNCSHPFNTAPCDDGDACTSADACASGVCAGGGTTDCDDGEFCTNDSCDSVTGCSSEPIPLFSTCYWIAVAGDPGRSIDIRTRDSSDIGGALCMDEGDIGVGTIQRGSVVATEAVDTRAIQFRLGAIVEEDIVTGGGGLAARGSAAVIPGTLLTSIAPGSPDEAKAPSGFAITTSGDARVDECHEVQDGIDSAAAFVDALIPTASLGNVVIRPGNSYTISAAPAGCGADSCLDCTGDVCVVDIGKLRLNNQSTFTIDANGNADSVFIFRMSNGIQTKKNVDIVLANGAIADHVLFHVQSGSCKLGISTAGSGTLLCADAKMQVRENTEWTGSLLGGKSQLYIGISVLLNHAPFTGL